jgi:phage terminase large subunit GpA-like protein
MMRGRAFYPGGDAVWKEDGERGLALPLPDKPLNARGNRFELARVYVDFGGHRSKQVFSYTKGRTPKVYAIRGTNATDPKQWVTPFPAKLNIPSHKEIDTGGVKTEIDIRLRIEPGNAGFIHFPMLEGGQPARGADINYFKDLVREYKRSRNVNGRLVSRCENPWGRQNESWDTLVYSFSALYELGGRIT